MKTQVSHKVKYDLRGHLRSNKIKIIFFCDNFFVTPYILKTYQEYQRRNFFDKKKYDLKGHPMSYKPKSF